MKKLPSSILNLLLAIGVVFILVGIFFAFQFVGGDDVELRFLSAAIPVAGAALVYVALAFRHNAFVFFSGIYLFLVGVLWLVVSAFPGGISVIRLWPAGLVLCAVSLFLTSLFRYSRLRCVYAFPGAFLFAFGGVCLLFSFDVVKIPFVNFMSRWWPLMLIVFGGILVSIFLYQQTPGNKFPYDGGEADSEQDGACS